MEHSASLKIVLSNVNYAVNCRWQHESRHEIFCARPLELFFFQPVSIYTKKKINA